MGTIEVRPRSTGEILDEAWRLYFANGSLLLALSSLFTVPFFVVLLCLLTMPESTTGWHRWFWPAAAALTLPLSGLGSGACQEAFRRSAEGSRLSLRGCLSASLRHGGSHVATRALTGAAFLLGIWLLLMPGLAVLVSAVSVHPILAAGEGRIFAAWRSSSQEAQRQPAKTASVILSRIPLLFLAVANLYLLVGTGIWTAEHLGGLDLAYAGVLLSTANPVYLLSLIMLAWLLLSPYFEAANYLLHVDARARYEGLDLWYRVRRFFPPSERIGAGALLLALGLVLVTPASTHAEAVRLATVTDARQEIQSILSEISKSEPYPGSERWNQRLQRVVSRLEQETPSGKSRYRWFEQAIEGFGHRGRESALAVLTDLDRKLGLIEESLRRPPQAAQEDKAGLSTDELKKLLPSQENGKNPGETKPHRDEQRPRKQRIERRAEEEQPEADAPRGAAPRGPGLVAPHPQGGFNGFGWLIVAGILVAILVVGLNLYRQGRRRPAAPAVPQTGDAVPSLETILTSPNQYSVTGLWREADELARAGRAREAVRTLYLAVLALLHRGNLIRFERTRTNGEYVRQLRDRETLRKPFAGITSLFEVKWYSESACEPKDYAACRELAENIRASVRAES